MACSPLQPLKVISRSLNISPSIKNRERVAFRIASNSQEVVSPSRSPDHKSKYYIASPPINNGTNITPNTKAQFYGGIRMYNYKNYYIHKTKASIGCYSSPGDISFNTPDRIKFSKEMNKQQKVYNLGNGAFGFVVKGNYKGKRVAVKVVPKHKMSSLKNEENGIILIHPNIIQMYKIIIEKEYGLIFMERNFGLNIQELLHEMCISLNAPDRFRYMLNIAHALEHCHQMGVLHLDVKPKNILLCTSKNTCKLCDFGCSLLVEEIPHHCKEVNLGVNTVCYTDPQLLLGELPSHKSDVYSYGITMWQLLAEEIPYEGSECHTIIFKVVSEDYRPKNVLGRTDYDKKYIQLYESCWKSLPEMRPNLNKIVEELEIILSGEMLYDEIS